MQVKNPVSLSDLARELSINKSKLTYYVKLGILKSVGKIGKTQIFERDEVLKRLKNVKEVQSKQLATLEEIARSVKSK
jgi:DNA-binding transcriptional MerR regulator